MALVELPKPSLWPKSMKQYGANPFGGDLWRVAYAPSVRHLVGGRFADGHIGYRARKLYSHLGNCWVLEKWLSAYEFTRKTEAKYNEDKDPETGLIPTGPYPHRGVYVLTEPLACSPEDANFDLLIKLINKGQYNRTQDNAKALMDTMDRKDKADQAERFDRCKELLPAFGIRAASFRGHVKPTKSAPIMKSANELGLPVNGPSVHKVNHAV